MPVETHTVSLKPCNFFTANPALDVPVSTQAFNQSRTVEEDGCKGGQCVRDAKL